MQKFQDKKHMSKHRTDLSKAGWLHGVLTTRAPYDLKIYLTTELYNFVKNIAAEYDPYS